MDSQSVMSIILLIIMVALSAFFSASETAFSSFNRIRMKNMAGAGKKGAKLVLKLDDNYDKLLSTILVGNNIVNIASASVATVLFTKFFLSNGAAVSTAVMTIVVLIFGEVTPKSLAKEHAEAFALFSAPLLRGLMIVLTPVNFLFTQWKKLVSKLFHAKEHEGITEEELMTIVDDAQQEGGIDEHEGELIRSAIEFNEVDTEDILTPVLM